MLQNEVYINRKGCFESKVDFDTLKRLYYEQMLVKERVIKKLYNENLVLRKSLLELTEERDNLESAYLNEQAEVIDLYHIIYDLRKIP